MPTWSWIAIAVVVVIIVVLALIAGASIMRKKRSDRLKDQFGPEYERAVDSAGGQRAAEKELLARERKHKKLDITELTPQSRARYEQAWQETQAGFVDNPSQSVSEADRLVTEVLRERGYPIDDFEERAADISVDHPKVVEHYRAGHVLHLAQQHGEIGTEAQREALVHYRTLFEELLRPDHETHEADATHETHETPAERETGTDTAKGARK
ncbi:hypothetical protein A5784_35865 [Mycobacterium sp. 852013-50091_SCH5140682]|uniref:hypothetical protein n=1 Tax=Mycobacterium sp. 852013-50091_SCH5140682 TaxID=1834109 RepID=UPI0007E94E15|nr:hypothetical protein [Mycobacterium sp. 852013-50091_SCH5140682]OBC10887.1 hypothetical protein A5784_35865 [Mycobacterium sp. 852013-50091_SCH5140682]